ncbi:helix-turn-helix domain-containing protein [Streptomyces fumanus]|uniref:helix-turn-helix domain-containing protein n=1 Tax=Streptomyces fumanus TaxID=67302 RepID=UPI0033DEDB55
MPRWKALPDDLDPQIREFAGQLRRLVDRSDLSVAALADATGYSKTSWEKYLNGRLLAPKGAVVALAEVTETDPVHLTTMWELAERAWSRAEMRHDRTIEAIRIAQARAALGEPGGGRNETKGGRSEGRSGGRAEGLPDGRSSGRAGGREGGGNATAAPGATDGPAGPGPTRPTGPAGPGPAGPTGPGPTAPGSAAAGPAFPPVPSQPTAADSADSATERDGAVRDRGPAAASPGSGPAGGESAPVNSWGLAGYRGPAPSGPRRGGAVPGRDATMAFGGPPAAPSGPRPSVPGGPRPSVPGTPYGTPPPYGGGPHGTPPTAPRPRRGPAGKRRAMFAGGVVGVLGVLAGAFFLLHDGGERENEGAKPSPSPTATARKSLPPGVKCSGDQCTGKDAEAMGCGGDLVTTEQSVTVGTTLVEVRYSKVCGAVWGRVTQAAQGDEVEVSAGKAKQTGSVTTAGDTIAYTPMVAVPDAADATACVTLASGEKGCTP